MTPFPETEIMTIKRIEVALRKLDLKLLKDGAYKLHEKFHSGYRFEFIDLLRDIYIKISTNTSIPNDIKGILIPTIEDILKTQGQNVQNIQPVQQNMMQNAQTNLNQGQDEVFKSFTPIQTPTIQQTNINHTINHPAQQINQPIRQPISQPIAQTQTSNPLINQTNTQQPYANHSFNQPIQQPIGQTAGNMQNLGQSAVQNSTISVFYGSETTKEQEDRIYQYKKLISDNANIEDLTSLTSKILMNEKIDITDLSLILNILKQKSNNVNLLTNSKSEAIVKVLEDSGLNRSLFDFTKENKKIKFFPLLGLNGLFKCKKCKREHFEIWEDTMPVALLCPNCKSPMFIDFAYSNDLDLSVNMEYYNASIYALTESRTWLLVNPPLFDKIIIDLLKSALKISKVVEEIYIVSSKVEIADKYKSVFYSTGKNVRIDTSTGTLNNFWSSLG